MRILLLVAASVLPLSACQATEPANPAETLVSSDAQEDLATRAGAPLFEGMGAFHRPITTASADAQKYFDQGMVLAFGFNHAESIRSFRAAQKLDPGCAMCFWGEALATGPNINVTSKGKAVMSPQDRAAAYAAIQKAVALKDTASPAERDLIEALATRYSADLEAERVITSYSIHYTKLYE